jgi:hypothetical protein
MRLASSVSCFGRQKIDLANLLEVHLDRIVDFDVARLDLREFVDVGEFFFLLVIGGVIVGTASSSTSFWALRISLSSAGASSVVSSSSSEITLILLSLK